MSSATTLRRDDTRYTRYPEGIRSVHSDNPAMLLLATTLRPRALRRKPRHPLDNQGGAPTAGPRPAFDNPPGDEVGPGASLPRHTGPTEQIDLHTSRSEGPHTMTMGDRIKTRQQLLDEQIDANARATHGDDRHEDSTRPHQTHDSTAEHANQDGAQVPGGVDAVRQELEQLRERMAVIKQEATVEVDHNWSSPWRTPAMFDLKVKTKLTGHQEYRSLQDRVRDATASLATESKAATQGQHG